MPSAGELMARKLRGDPSVTMEDVKKATEEFFGSNGVQVNVVTAESFPKKETSIQDDK